MPAQKPEAKKPTEEKLDTNVETQETETPTETEVETETETPDAPVSLDTGVDKKTAVEITQEKVAAQEKEKAERADTTTVFSSITTNHGPKFVVVEMPKVDQKAFGKSVIKSSKLPVGTRVDCNGNELEEGQEVDENGVIITE